MLKSLGFGAIGIDNSRHSIEWAEQHVDASFVCASADELLGIVQAVEPNLLTFVMSPHCILGFDEVLEDISPHLQQGTRIHLSLANPGSFLLQPKYRNLCADLERETVLELSFRVRDCPVHPAKVTHFHRPVRYYKRALRRAGFVLDFCESAAKVGPLADVLIVQATKA
jgi:hypothetical protein